MRSILFSIFIIISTAIPLFSQSITLKERLIYAPEGSYLVFEQNKNFTFFHIFENRKGRILIEEVSVPGAKLSCEDKMAITQSGWKYWFEKGAPQHTSWTMALINLQSGKFEEMFSFTQKGWIDISKMDTFMTTLFNLSFEEVSESERKHIGLPPGRSKMDTRPLWHPRLVVEGRWIPNVFFFVWKARWPSDNSDLSRKIIELYLPEERNDPSIPDYPTYFPYVIEVEGKIGSAKIRVVDSGMNAISPMTKLPLRPPQLIGSPQWQNNQLVITIKAPLYFEDFLLFAQEEGCPFDQPISLPFTMVREGERVILYAHHDDLKPQLFYRLNIIPKDNPEYCLETEPLQTPTYIP